MKAIERINTARMVINELVNYQGNFDPFLTEQSTSNGVALCLDAEGHGTPTALVHAYDYDDLGTIWNTIRSIEKLRGKKYI